jgi:hypothetical protein
MRPATDARGRRPPFSHDDYLTKPVRFADLQAALARTTLSSDRLAS